MHLLPNRTDRQLRYRSVKYKLSRGSSFVEQSTQPITAQNSLFFASAPRNNSAKKVSFNSKILPLNRTMYSRKSNPQDSHLRDSSYMNTVNKLISMEKNKYNAKQKQQEQQTSQQFVDRIQLPSLKQGDSYFTVLDNINIPIDYLKKQIVKLNKGVKQEIPKMQQIAADMRIFQKKQLNKLEECEEIGVNAFEKLRNMLHMNHASQQNFSLRIKRQIKECKQYLPEYYESLEKTKQRLIQLQKTIFSNEPFELQLAKERETSSQQQIPYF